MDYFKKYEENPYADLRWNIPEQKRGKINIIGGNSQNFRTIIKASEFISASFPIKDLEIILPDALKSKLPNLPNFIFLASTESGSFQDKKELEEAINSADMNILIGDLSKNSVTGKAVLGASENSAKPLIITRDTIDLISENHPDRLLMNPEVSFFLTTAQLQKLLRSVYYPKMLLLSQSLVQVTEILHKFTLSYPVSIITLHNEQVLVAKNGSVQALPLEKTGYSPMTFWFGEAVVKVAVYNLFNPNQFIEASISGLFS